MKQQNQEMMGFHQQQLNVTPSAESKTIKADI